MKANVTINSLYEKDILYDEVREKRNNNSTDRIIFIPCNLENFY